MVRFESIPGKTQSTHPVNNREEMKSNRLLAAINLLQEGNRPQARKLILAEVKENPSELEPWLWALEVANNEKEERTILKKILALDPNHEGAQRYIRKLDQAQIPAAESSTETSTQTEDSSKKPSRLVSLLLLPLQWIFSLPLSCGFIFLITVTAVGGYLYFRANTSFFGLVGTDFDTLVISNAYEKITSDDLYWEVQFEGQGESKYIGTVRHVSPIRIKEYKILTHDILVTTGDYSNPDIVETSVINHKFFWKPDIPSLTGTIHLIHAVPANKGIYQQLLTITNRDIVKLTGREIYSIKAYKMDETFLGTWMDTSCNTLLVETVSVLKPSDQE